MPRASISGYSNGAADERVEYEEVSPSAGISSLTSESKQDKSGTSTGTDPQSPAPETGSHSSKDQPQNLESSTAPTTDGVGQETSSGPQSQQDSSADSAQGAQATQGRATKGAKRGSAS